jgi:hypothetical protein
MHLSSRRFLRLHPDTIAERTLPFPLLVVNVALQFFHGQFTNLTRHLISNVAKMMDNSHDEAPALFARSAYARFANNGSLTKLHRTEDN